MTYCGSAYATAASRKPDRTTVQCAMSTTTRVGFSSSITRKPVRWRVVMNADTVPFSYTAKLTDCGWVSPIRTGFGPATTPGCVVAAVNPTWIVVGTGAVYATESSVVLAVPRSKTTRS